MSNEQKLDSAASEGIPPRLDYEQRHRAMLIAESRGIDLDTAYELVFLRDRVSPSVDEVALRIAQKVVFFKSGGDPAQDVLPLAEIIEAELRTPTVCKWCKDRIAGSLNNEAAVRRAADRVLNNLSVNEFREMQRLNKYQRIAEIIASELKTDSKYSSLAIFNAGFSDSLQQAPVADATEIISTELASDSGKVGN